MDTFYRGPPLPNVTWHSGGWPYTVTPSIDQTLHQFLTLLLISTLLPHLTFYLVVRGFHRTFATGAACPQRTLTPPDTWSCPTLGLACVLMLRPISPERVLFPDFWVSNIPRYFCFALQRLWKYFIAILFMSRYWNFLSPKFHWQIDGKILLIRIYHTKIKWCFSATHNNMAWQKLQTYVYERQTDRSSHNLLSTKLSHVSNFHVFFKPLNMKYLTYNSSYILWN